jgi:hypothetical protein
MNYKVTFTGFTLMFLIFGVFNCGQKENSPDTDSGQANLSKVAYAGVRSSNYGIKPFPNCEEWKRAMLKMSSYFEGSTPSAIWIVGSLSNQQGCRLFFPSEGKSFDHIIFTEEDIHEAYLTCFDQAGIKVFLQVEPGDANVDTLIDLVLNRYQQHPCVIGFGIDVEWHRQSEKRGWGIPVKDNEAKAWETRIKQHNPNYKLFLKHWDRDWMPPTYRGEIIFISDSQELANLDAMVDEFSNYWADYFKPNPVYFQIGYRADRPWWEKFDTPAKNIGDAIIEKVEQETGIFWVDFTLREVLLNSSEVSSE